MLAINMHDFQASEASLAAFAERYAVAAASTAKSGVCLDLERIEAEAAGVAAPASEEGRHSQKGGINSSEESSEETSEESSDDGSEESSSEDDSSSSGEEESSSEEEEEEVKIVGKGEEQEKIRLEEAEANSTLTKQPNGAVDGGEGSTTDEQAVPTKDVAGVAVGAGGQDRVGKTPGSGSTSSTSTSCGARTGSGVERNSDLLHLESRVDDGPGRAASVVTSRLSSLSLEKQPRGPLDGAVGTVGKKKADASARGEGSGVSVGAGDGRRKNLIQEL